METLIDQGAGVVECRICGLMFVPELEEDREGHEIEHRRIICGALPYDLREVLKRSGWEAAQPQEGEGSSPRSVEIGKRAIVFGWWMRALWNGAPATHCDPYMKAHFALIDAIISGNQEAAEKARKVKKRWVKYGG